MPLIIKETGSDKYILLEIVQGEVRFTSNRYQTTHFKNAEDIQERGLSRFIELAKLNEKGTLKYEAI